MVSLASVSDSLKVWKFDESNSLNLSSRFIPTSLLSSPQKIQSNQIYMNSIAWNHTNQVIAASGIDAKIYLIQANNGQVLSSLPINTDTDTNKITNSKSVSFSNNSRYLTSTLNSSLQLWDLKKRQLKKVMLGHTSDITSTCFHFSGEIISGDRNGIVKIWDTKTNFQELSELKLTSNHQLASSLSVTSISVPYLTTTTSGGGGMIAIGYTSGDLCIWDSNTSQLVRKQSYHIGSLTSLAYSPKNHRLVATVGSDGKLALIDTGSKTSLEPSASVIINNGVYPINSVSFHEDAIHSAVGLENGQIMVYDWRNIRKPIAVVDAHTSLPVKSVAFQVPKSLASSATSLPSQSSQSSSLRASADSTTTTKIQTVPASVDTHERTTSPNVSSGENILSPTVTHHAPVSTTIRSPVNSSNQSEPLQDTNTKSLNNSIDESIVSNTTIPSRAVSNNIDNNNRIKNITQQIENKISNKTTNGGLINTKVTTSNVQSVNSNQSKYHTGLISDEEKNSFPRDAYIDTAESSFASLKYSKQTNIQDTTIQLPKSTHNTPSAIHQNIPTSTTSSVSTPIIGRSESRADENSFQRQSHPQLSQNKNITHHPVLPPTPPPPPPTTTPLISNPQTHAHTHSHPLNPQQTIHQAVGLEEYSTVTNAIRTVTVNDLEESLHLLRYDIHREVQDIIREQIRQFTIAKDETASLIKDMSVQLAELLKANKELREENEYLRRIY